MSRFLSNKYASLEPYTPGEQPKTRVLTKLNTNESPFPPMPEVVEAVKKEAEILQLYPDPDSTELRKALAKRFDVDPDMIICNNGSDETLYFAFLAYCDGETPAVFPKLSYGFYPVFADITAPTGVSLSRDQIEGILQHNQGNVVVIDEAYVDFGTESAVPLTKKYDNLLVVQTFSKSRSMAGMRLGYGIASPEIISDLNALRYSTNPYNIDRLAIAAGVASLENDTVEQLKALGFEMTDSTANFIFVRHPEIGGDVLFQKLRERGVIIRHWFKPEINDYNRITIGSREQMDILLREVRDIFKEAGI